MINKRIIAKAIGGLLALEAALMALCMVVAFYHNEPALHTWALPITATLTVRGGNSWWGSIFDRWF